MALERLPDVSVCWRHVVGGTFTPSAGRVGHPCQIPIVRVASVRLTFVTADPTATLCRFVVVRRYGDCSHLLSISWIARAASSATSVWRGWTGIEALHPADTSARLARTKGVCRSMGDLRERSCTRCADRG